MPFAAAKRAARLDAIDAAVRRAVKRPARLMAAPTHHLNG
jgi:hypothetical protein